MVIYESTRLIAENYERVWAGHEIEDCLSKVSSKQNPMFHVGFEI